MNIIKGPKEKRKLSGYSKDRRVRRGSNKFMTTVIKDNTLEKSVNSSLERGIKGVWLFYKTNGETQMVCYQNGNIITESIF